MFGKRCIVPISLLTSTKNSKMQPEKHEIIKHFLNPDLQMRVVVIVVVIWHEIKACEGQQGPLKHQLAENNVNSSTCISSVPTTTTTENINTEFCSEITDVCMRSLLCDALVFLQLFCMYACRCSASFCANQLNQSHKLV